MPFDADSVSEDAVALARRCVEALYAGDRASQHLGMAIVEAAPGRATVRMAVTETMLNGFGICHGGYVTLLADSAFAFACNTRNHKTVAQSLDVMFLRPAYAGDLLTAAAIERALVGRTGVYDVTVSRGSTEDGRGDAEVVAEFRGRSRTVSGPVIAQEVP